MTFEMCDVDVIWSVKNGLVFNRGQKHLFLILFRFFLKDCADKPFLINIKNKINILYTVVLNNMLLKPER